jgi:single-stranded DNA-binding protein
MQPELRYATSGSPILQFGIMVINYDKRAENNERAIFLDCVIYGHFAEVMVEKIKHKTQIVVSGHIDQDKWESQGQKHQKHKLVR